MGLFNDFLTVISGEEAKCKYCHRVYDDIADDAGHLGYWYSNGSFFGSGGNPVYSEKCAMKRLAEIELKKEEKVSLFESKYRRKINIAKKLLKNER